MYLSKSQRNVLISRTGKRSFSLLGEAVQKTCFELLTSCLTSKPYCLIISSRSSFLLQNEFVAIVKGEDYENLEKTMEKFDQAMLYSLVEYEQLIFSVARGLAKYEKGMYCKDVLQIADKAMYENKKYLKEKYNMKGR